MDYDLVRSHVFEALDNAYDNGYCLMNQGWADLKHTLDIANDLARCCKGLDDLTGEDYQLVVRAVTLWKEMFRLCPCGNRISIARRIAMPEATSCIECATKNDVAKIKRLDDHTGKPENLVCVETYFVHNIYFERAIQRLVKGLAFTSSASWNEQSIPHSHALYSSFENRACFASTGNPVESEFAEDEETTHTMGNGCTNSV
jgi:hypothetical protein